MPGCFRFRPGIYGLEPVEATTDSSIEQLFEEAEKSSSIVILPDGTAQPPERTDENKSIILSDPVFA